MIPRVAGNGRSDFLKHKPTLDVGRKSIQKIHPVSKQEVLFQKQHSCNVLITTAVIRVCFTMLLSCCSQRFQLDKKQKGYCLIKLVYKNVL